jgi:C-terminal processing protease CtpA/Prc
MIIRMLAPTQWTTRDVNVLRLLQTTAGRPGKPVENNRLQEELEMKEAGPGLKYFKEAGPGLKYFKFSNWDYVICEVFPGGAAHLHGVKPGERLLKIDDKDVAPLSATQVQRLLMGPHESNMKLTLGSPYFLTN